MPCSMVQMMRQLGVKDNYSLCSETGTDTNEARNNGNSLREQLNVSV